MRADRSNTHKAARERVTRGSQNPVPDRRPRATRTASPADAVRFQPSATSAGARYDKLGALGGEAGANCPKVISTGFFFWGGVFLGFLFSSFLGGGGGPGGLLGFLVLPCLVVSFLLFWVVGGCLFFFFGLGFFFFFGTCSGTRARRGHRGRSTRLKHVPGRWRVRSSMSHSSKDRDPP